MVECRNKFKRMNTYIVDAQSSSTLAYSDRPEPLNVSRILIYS